MKKLLFALAVLTLFASCKDAKEKFVASLVDAVNAKDVQALTALYPDAAELGELVTLDASATPVFNDTSECTEVTIGGVTFVLGNVGGKNFYVKSSKGLINVPQETMDLALATGWYNKELTDKENALALADTDFPEYVKKKMEQKNKSILSVSKQKYDKTYNFDNELVYWKYCLVVKNNSDIEISGADYKLNVVIKDSGYDWETSRNYSKSTANTYDGKDISAHGSVTYNNMGDGSSVDYGPQYEKIPHCTIEYTPEFEKKISSGLYTGNEYNEYLISKNK